MNQIVTMTDAEYRAHPALNFSTIKHGLRSLAHMQHARTAQQEETPSMRLGTALHVAALQRSRWSELVAVAPDVDKRTKAGKDEWAAFVAESAGKTVITTEQEAEVKAMYRALMTHPKASALLKSKGDRETVSLWTDKQTGLVCKAKIDLYLSGGLALDLKTTTDASIEAFSSTIYKYSYHMQAAFYSDGYRVNDGASTPFIWIAIENTAPYAVAVYTPDTPTIQRGRDAYRRVLDAYAKAVAGGCETSGYWPCYSPDIEPISLPAWAMKRETPRVEEGEEPNF